MNGVFQCVELKMRRERRPQLALRDLVEQSLVADLQDAGGLRAIPLDALEHFCQGLTLRLLGPTAGDIPQALRAGRTGAWGRWADLLAARDEVPDDRPAL